VDWNEARMEIERHSGTQFDPAIVAAYAGIPDEAFARMRDAIA
jgi:response regulator RpfG family c-di-GMP phosphodiesterase